MWDHENVPTMFPARPLMWFVAVALFSVAAGSAELPTPTPTTPPNTCCGDSDGDGAVSEDELKACVTIIGPPELPPALSCDCNHDGAVSVNEIAVAINNARNGCPGTTPRTPTPTPTPQALPCVGDCGADGAVTVDEIIRMVNIALGTASPSACPGLPQWCPFGPVADGIGISCVIQAVNNALDGCPATFGLATRVR